MPKPFHTQNQKVMEKSKLLLLGMFFTLLIPVWGYGQTTVWTETEEELFPPRNLEIHGFPGGGGATLFWEEPEQGEPLGYNIYRDDQVLNGETVNELFYDDSSAEIDSTYVYYVTALYENGESGPSNVVEYTPVHGYQLIYASAGENGYIDPEGVIDLGYGDDFDFDIVAHTGYRIDSLLVDNVVVPEAEGLEAYTYSFVNITDYHEIHATFALKTHSSDSEAEPKETKIFPNPAADKLYVIPGSDFHREVNYTVYDLTGRALLSGIFADGNNILDISPLGTGVYLLEIREDNRSLTTLKFEKR